MREFDWNRGAKSIERNTQLYGISSIIFFIRVFPKADTPWKSRQSSLKNAMIMPSVFFWMISWNGTSSGRACPFGEWVSSTFHPIFMIIYHKTPLSFMTILPKIYLTFLIQEVPWKACDCRVVQFIPRIGAPRNDRRTDFLRNRKFGSKRRSSKIQGT